LYACGEAEHHGGEGLMELRRRYHESREEESREEGPEIR
jgi:hypothetical protein